MKIELEQVRPQDIEKRSFEIISQELQERGKTLNPETESIVKRAIHTSADFDYAENLCFSEEVVNKAVSAILGGAHFVTDTHMALSGINKKNLQALGCTAQCFMAEESVAKEAAERGCTRATVSMERAALLTQPLILAVGNAPTALVRLYEMIEQQQIAPRLIIGVPVGFVNVVEAKELILRCDVPYIVARGRKGGSNVAAAICNALLLLAKTEKERGAQL